MFSVLLMRAFYDFEKKVNFNRRGAIETFGKKFNYDLQVFVLPNVPDSAAYPDSRIQHIQSNMYNDIKPIVFESVETALFGIPFNDIYYFETSINNVQQFVCLKVSLEEFSLFGN